MNLHEINDMVDYDGEISVIIPCYNYAHYIKEAIESLRSSTYKDFCCIIVNDGSSDNSEEVIKECVGDDDRFHYFRIENHGLAYVRNFGIGKTKSKYVLSLDPDDKISPTYIVNAISFLNKNDDFPSITEKQTCSLTTVVKCNGICPNLNTRISYWVT